MTSTDIHNNCTLSKKFQSNVLSNVILYGEIQEPVAKLSCLSDLWKFCYNKFNQAKVIANALVPVMANTNIKVPLHLKLKLNRHTYSYIHLNIWCNKWFILVSEKLFKINNRLFSIGTPTTNKSDNGILVTQF